MKNNFLVNALSKNIDKMFKSSLLRSLKDGKDLVCPYCNQPVQPCKSNPSAMCYEMLLAGTEGRELEEAIKNCKCDSYGKCLSCGKKISTKHLKKHPTAELCPSCVKDMRRIKKHV